MLTAGDDTITVLDKARQAEGIGGVINEGEDPAVVVMNYKGWGITVNKVWSDADFMESHDTIYFAVFTDDGNGNLTLVDGTVRPMPTDTTSLYWYFDKLYNGALFENHVIREVTISQTNPELNEDGFVTNPGTVTAVEKGGALTVKAMPIESQAEAEYIYTASYQQGTVNSDENNVREDTVTNSRPGIRIKKTDLNGTPLPGAVFTLKDSQGRDIGQPTYTSDETGLVTVAYLPVGTFALTEIKSPQGYMGLTAPVTITKAEDGSVTVTGDDQSFVYSIATETTDGVITVKNKSFSLKAVKVDATHGDIPLHGVHFALYRQVKATSGGLIRDYYPIAGFEDLVSGADGVIPNITQQLPSGTYYLHETQALETYSPIETDICFTITDTGSVVLHNDDKLADRLLSTETADAQVTYTITVKNAESWQKIRLKKVDIGDTSRALKNAVFDLYRGENDEGREEPALYTNMTSGADGIITYTKDGTEYTLLDLPVGVYYLVETSAPAGYNIKAEPVVITISSTKVIYDEGTTLSQSGSGISYDAAERTYTLKISNSAGYELPSTGGPGTKIFTILGSTLILFSVVQLLRRRSRRLI